MKIDNVIVAIGQQPSIDASEFKIEKNGTIEVDSRTLETSLQGVFAGGDCVTGPSTVIEAINFGHKAALSIDKYLGGTLYKRKREYSRKADYLPDETHMERCKIRKLEPKERKGNFAEVELCLSEEDAYQEAYRCLRCDIKDVGEAGQAEME